MTDPKYTQRLLNRQMTCASLIFTTEPICFPSPFLAIESNLLYLTCHRRDKITGTNKLTQIAHYHKICLAKKSIRTTESGTSTWNVFTVLEQALPTISCTTVAWHSFHLSIRAKNTIKRIAIVIRELLQWWYVISCK